MSAHEPRRSDANAGSLMSSMKHNRPALLMAAVSAVAIIAAVWGWSAADRRGQDRDEARQRLVAVQQELTAAKDSNQKMTAELARAQTEIDTTKRNFAELGDNLRRTTVQFQELTKERQALIQDRDRFQQQFSELQGKVGQRAAVQSDLDRMRADVDRAQAQLNEVKADRERSNAEAQSARQRAADLQNQLQQDEQRLQQLQASLTEADRQMEDARQALTAAERRAQDTTEQVAASERRLTELQNAATQAAQNLSQITADIAQQTQVVTETRANAAAAAQQLATLNETRTDLQNQIDDLQQQRTTVEAETARQRATLPKAGSEDVVSQSPSGQSTPSDQ